MVMGIGEYYLADCLLAQMRGWEERERSWARFRRDFEGVQRKKLLRRIGGRLLPT